MIRLFRATLLLSMIVIAAASVLPLRQPVEMDLPMGGPMPIWLLGAPALFVAALAGTVASIGLMLLRKWARLVGVATVVVAAWGFLLVTRSPLASLLDSFSGRALIAGFVAWACAVAWSFHASVASRLKA